MVVAALGATGWWAWAWSRRESSSWFRARYHARWRSPTRRLWSTTRGWRGTAPGQWRSDGRWAWHSIMDRTATFKGSRARRVLHDGPRLASASVGSDLYLYVSVCVCMYVSLGWSFKCYISLGKGTTPTVDLCPIGFYLLLLGDLKQIFCWTRTSVLTLESQSQPSVAPDGVSVRIVPEAGPTTQQETNWNLSSKHLEDSGIFYCASGAYKDLTGMSLLKRTR